MRRWIVILIAAIAIAAPAAAQQVPAGSGPAIPRASGEPHAEGNAYMRRWHMSMMKHDRDKTMYQGQRDVTASIGECFDCHTVRNEAGTPVTVADERHFCRVCHDYAAVQVDCFDCHRSTPADFEEPAPHAANDPAHRSGHRPAQRSAKASVRPGNADVARIVAYLDDVAATATEARQ